MNNYYIKGFNDEWIRPAGWLTMPTITSADNKMAFLFAVYDNRENCFSISTGTGSWVAAIDWGDGTSTTLNSTVIRDKRYTYSSITSPILQDYYGVDYKQVIVTVTYTSGTIGAITLNTFNGTIGGPGNRSGVNQILEGVISWDNNLIFSARSSWPFLESLDIKKLKFNGAATSNLAGLTNLKNLQGVANIYTSTTSTSNYTCQFMGKVNKFDLTWNSGAGSVTSFFSGSLMRELGNITFNGTGGAAQAFINCGSLEKIGNVNFTAHPSLISAFANCYALKSIGTITTTNNGALTTCFSNCYSLKEVVFTDCSAVTVAGGAVFTACVNLSRCVLPELKFAVTVANCNLGRDAILELCTSLGTASTSQALTLTGNPGLITTTAAEINAILNPKSWTYIA